MSSFTQENIEDGLVCSYQKSIQVVKLKQVNKIKDKVETQSIILEISKSVLMSLREGDYFNSC